MSTPSPNPAAESGRRVLYIDMDNTLVNFTARLEGIDHSVREAYRGREDELPGLFALMPPMPGAIEAFRELASLFDTYILSTAPWGNPSAWQHKVEWVQLHFGLDERSPAYKRLILTHHKDLNRGDFLVDDRPKHRGVDRFQGEVLHFGKGGRYETWADVLVYLRTKAGE